MDNWLKKNKLDLRALHDDYDHYGRQEHIDYLEEAASVVKLNLQNNIGVLKQ